MSKLADDDIAISKGRLHTAICLIMTLEHSIIDLEELIRATGMTFIDTRKAMHNLSMLKLVSVEPIYRGVPKFRIINRLEANKFLKLLGF